MGFLLVVGYFVVDNDLLDFILDDDPTASDAGGDADGVNGEEVSTGEDAFDDNAGRAEDPGPAEDQDKGCVDPDCLLEPLISSDQSPDEIQTSLRDHDADILMKHLYHSDGQSLAVEPNVEAILVEKINAMSGNKEQLTTFLDDTTLGTHGHTATSVIELIDAIEQIPEEDQDDLFE